MIAKSGMRATKNHVAAESREKLVAMQNGLLAALTDLHSQLKQAHWNLRGPGFIALHEMFDEAAGEVTGYIDDVAERIGQLGGLASGTVRDAAAATPLAAYPEGLTEQAMTIEVVSTALAETAKRTRQAIDDADNLGDQVTADLYTEITAGLDKTLWFVESHVG
ncbi:DNA starvation/stationary phase protection protein Dps [Mucisphaera calidilacus]|uniref:DNA protection during starvation protein n=1 Tax=Mucisphaera calidilacus TaxID=2527982 RepID=A0A518BTW7_9BACT|nr:DNA starvation/stationary phase protection protein Dps [Mucisphaera calidilacus]QDU70428.1 DNA protection during starvation protein [Mucisphaera calidilacus]